MFSKDGSSRTVIAPSCAGVPGVFRRRRLRGRRGPSQQASIVVKPDTIAFTESATDIPEGVAVVDGVLIQSVEFLGRASLVTCEIDGVQLRARVGRGAPTPAPGSTACIFWDPSDSHLILGPQRARRRGPGVSAVAAGVSPSPVGHGSPLARRARRDHRRRAVPGPCGFPDSARAIVGPQGSFTLAHYGEFFGEALYQRVLVRTAVLNAIVALIAAALAYPATLYLATRAGASARILLGLLTLPLLVGGTSLAYGWVIMFSRSGPLDRMAVSLFGGSNFVLINSEAGIVIGLVHILLPFMTFSLLASYDRLDWNAVRAARSLGAGPIQTFPAGDAAHDPARSDHGHRHRLLARRQHLHHSLPHRRRPAILLMSTLSYQQNVSLWSTGSGVPSRSCWSAWTAVMVSLVLLFERQGGEQSHE